MAYVHTNDNLTSVDLTEDGRLATKRRIVVDTSGSMEDEVSAATGERDGFSIMDVTKHGILTCLCGLRSEEGRPSLHFLRMHRSSYRFEMDARAKPSLESPLPVSLQTVGQTSGPVLSLLSSNCQMAVRFSF